MTPSAPVLVTGATGFIGRHALEPLARRGFEVHAVSRGAPPAGSARQVRWHRADLLDADTHRSVLTAVAPTHLLHLACYAGHGRFWTSTENLRWSARRLRSRRRSPRAVAGARCSREAPRSTAGVTRAPASMA